MGDDLDRLIRNHYRTFSTPDAVRERLVALTVDQADLRRRGRGYLWGSLAAAGLVAALVWWSIADVRHAGPSEIAASVAAQFHHRKADDIVASRVGDIAQGLPRLDFTLRLPQRDGLPNWRVEGGRYCSIAGNIAAQVRLTDERGGQHTLYVSRCAGAVASIADFSVDIDGITVCIWREHELTYAWATAVR